MKFLIILVLSSNAVCGFVPYATRTRTTTFQRALVKPLGVVSDLKTSDEAASSNKGVPYTIPLDKICLEDIPKVGGKTASLGEMIQQLQPLGVDVPGGYGVSSAAYDAMMNQFHLRERIDLVLKDLDGKCRRMNNIFVTLLLCCVMKILKTVPYFPFQ